MATYESPRITELGSLTELTQGKSTGDFLDFDFPSGTPFGDLTFTN